MTALLSLLQIRPIWVTLLCASLSLLAYSTWPFLVQADTSRRGVWVVTGLALLWTLIEWIIHMGRQLREQKTRRGLLLTQCSGALVQLAREYGGERSGSADAVLALPWVLVVGPQKAGKSQFLASAGMRRVASCSDEGGAAVCSFWLARDAGRESVFLELTGAAFADHEATAQVVRWLVLRRGGLDAVLLLVSLGSLWGGGGEQAHAVALDCSSGLRRIFSGLSTEVVVHVVAQKCDCIDGMTSFFSQFDNRPWGFQINRPLHSGLPTELLTDRLATLIESIWEYRGESLDGAKGVAELEAVLDFPREARRHGELLSRFLGQLAAQFSPETRARLGETFLVCAGSQPSCAIEAERYQRLREVPAARSLPAELGRGSYFVRGALIRIIQHASGGTGPKQSARQGLWLWAGALLCVIGMAASSRLFFSRRLALERVKTWAESLTGSIDGMHRGSRQIDLGARGQAATSIVQFFEQEQRVQLVLAREPCGSSPMLTTALGKLREAAVQYDQCRLMHRLVWPLLRYDPRDEVQRRPMPLVERLRLFLRPAAERPGHSPAPAEVKKEGGSAGSLSEGLEALYATALIRRRSSCVTADHDALARWMGQYFSGLWPLDAGAALDLRKQIEQQLAPHFKRYLDDVKDCTGLAGKLNLEMLGEAQKSLSQPGELDSKLGGFDSEAALEWALRVHEYLGRKDVRAGPYAPRLQFFTADHAIPAEFTRQHCNRLAQDRSVALRWLACLRDVNQGSLSNQGNIEESRLVKYYGHRNGVVWSEFLGHLGRKTRPSLPGSNPLADIAEDLPRLTGDLQILFTTIGIGDKTGEPLQVLCQVGAQGFAPFRWAVGADDDSGAQRSQELENQWREYSTEIGQLREQLVALVPAARPLPAAEAFSIAIAAEEKLATVMGRRERWLTTLKNEVPPAQQAAIGHLNELLKRYEDDIRLALRDRSRRAASCLFADIRSWWTGQLPPKQTPKEQLAQVAETLRAALQPRLTDYQEHTLNRVSDLRPEFGREVRAMLTALNNAPETPRGGATAAAPQKPTMMPVPNSICGAQRIYKITLDIPELQHRYVCDTSGGCLVAGPSLAQSAIELKVQWAEGGTSSVQTFNDLHDLLARAERTPDRSQAALFTDPFQPNKRRHRITIPLTVTCRNMNPPRSIQIYMDEALMPPPAKLARWVEPNFFDAASSAIERCQ